MDLKNFDAKGWNEALHTLVNAVKSGFLLQDLLRAQESSTCKLYMKTLVMGDVDYFDSGLSCADASLIFKLRCNLLNLNGRVWSKMRNKECSICNMNLPEDTYHFIAVCPLFRETRLSFIGKKIYQKTSF